MSDQVTPEFQPPPPPDFPEQPTGPQMSVGQTLTSVFFEPTTTFESLRARPRFLVASIITIVAVMAFFTLYYQRIGQEKIVRAAIENSPRTAQLTPEQREQQIQMQSKPIFKAIGYVAPVIGIAIIFAAGAALYLLGAMLMGGRMGYKQALSVWAYSSFPPTLIAMLLNIILLFIKSEDSYDIVLASRSGLVQANLSFMADPKTSPAIFTLLGSIDVFQFYGLFLAAVGMRLISKLSSGSAWAVVLTLFLIGVVLKVGASLLFGAM